MRPHRVRLTHSLVESYGLLEKLKLRRPSPLDSESISAFHADGEDSCSYSAFSYFSPSLTLSSNVFTVEYVDFLGNVTPENQDEYMTQLRRFNLGPAGEADCPVFDGLFDYCKVRRKGCFTIETKEGNRRGCYLGKNAHSILNTFVQLNVHSSQDKNNVDFFLVVVCRWICEWCCRPFFQRSRYLLKLVRYG